MLGDIFHFDFFDAIARTFLEHGADAECVYDVMLRTAPLEYIRLQPFTYVVEMKMKSTDFSAYPSPLRQRIIGSVEGSSRPNHAEQRLNH